MAPLLDAVTVATVLDSVCGYILMYIFIKIYIVVKDRADNNAQKCNDDVDVSFNGVRVSINLERPEENAEIDKIRE